MKSYEKWFKKAENDLKAIKILLSTEDVPSDICCFHAQQAAEKYLKAYLVSNNIAFSKTHDLELLLNLLSKKNIVFTSIVENVRSISDYGISPRYPDEIDEPTIDDAKKAYEHALIIKDFILKYFFE